MKLIKGQTPRDIVLHESEYPEDLDPTAVVEIFQTPLTGAYNWDYTVQIIELKSL